VVEDFPDPEVLDDMGIEPGILGLYRNAAPEVGAR
jgi:predicted Zn-dependent protease with MMP-like domain